MSHDAVFGTYNTCMYRSLLFISTKINTKSWRHRDDAMYVKTVSKTQQQRQKKKWQKLSMTSTLLWTSDSHRVCDKSFLEWIVKYKKGKFGIPPKYNFIFLAFTHFWRTILLPGSTPVFFFFSFLFAIMSGKDGKTIMSLGHFRKKQIV